MEDTFEKLIELAKKKALEERGEEPKNHAGLSIRHQDKIISLLEENDSEDIIMFLDDITHEQFVISRIEKYACITGTDVIYSYFFNNDFSEFELILQ